MANEFGRRLQEKRKQKKLSQAAIADLCKIGTSTVSCYEKGTRVPNFETLLKLAEHLEVSPNYLLTGYEVFETKVDLESFIRNQPNLYIFDEPISESLKEDILMAIRITWGISKRKEKANKQRL